MKLKNSKPARMIRAGCLFRKDKQRHKAAATGVHSLFAGTVCHESAVGLSAKFSTASAFPTLPCLHIYYNTSRGKLMKNP